MKHKMNALGITIILLLAWFMFPLRTCAAGPCDGLPSGTLGGVVNTYYPGADNATAGDTSILVLPADTTSGGASTDIAPGHMLLVIQMQDADFNFTNNDAYGDADSTNPTVPTVVLPEGINENVPLVNGSTSIRSSGLFEYVTATNTVLANTGGTLTIMGGTGAGLLNSYHTASESNTHGQRRFQVVHIPRYNNATLTSTLTAAPWNGSTGGILAMDVCTIDLNNAAVSVDGKGFRGGGGRQWGGDPAATAADYRFWATDNFGTGSVGAHGVKGEGIAGTPRFVWDGTQVFNPDNRIIGYPAIDVNEVSVDASTARGAPGNAGGGASDGHPQREAVKNNNYNAGGGGGSNGGVGGVGGVCYSSPSCGLHGSAGAAFPAAFGPSARMTMGGGGGAGSKNDPQGPVGAASGGIGGGIVLFRACTVTGAGTITANGAGHEDFNFDVPGYTPAYDPTKPESKITSVFDGSGGGGAGGTVVVIAPDGGFTNLTVRAEGAGGLDNTQLYVGVQVPPGTNPVEYYRHGPGGGGGGGVVWLSGTPAIPASVAGGAHGVTTLLNYAYGSSDGQSGTLATNVSMGDLPGIQPPPCSPTWARIGGVRIDPGGVIEFATASQLSSKAFNIYETWDSKGRGERTLLTDEAIPAAPLAVMDPVLYRATTRPLKAPYILIEEVESGGGTHLMGPFPVADRPRAEQLSLLEERLAEKAARDQQEAAPAVAAFLQSASSPGTKASITAGGSATKALKIEVSRAGTVRVPVADLIRAGLPARYAATPKLLRLTNLGQSVPFKVRKNTIGPASIEFTSSPLATDYTGRNVYVVSWGATGAPEPTVKFTKSGFEELPGMTRFEKNQYSAPFVSPNGDPWIWDFLTATYAPELQFNLPNPLPSTSGSIPVRIGVYGATDDLHAITAFLNGSQVGQVTFSGKSMKEIRGDVLISSLNVGSNTVTFDVSGSADGALAFVDVIDLGLPLPLPTDVVSYDAIAPYDPSLPLNPRDLQYLIIAHGSFLKAANSIAASKSSEYRVAVIDVERAYDRYSAGVDEAEAIAALIAEIYKTSRQKLQYVLLIGSDSFDPRDFLGRGRVSYIPSLNGWDEIFGRVPSENRYADTNGDGLPEVAIGRLPVSTLAEAQVMAEKIANQAAMVAAGKGGPVQVMAVDNQGPNDASFYNAALEIRKHLPPGTRLIWANVGTDRDKARSNLLNGLQGGAQATHFLGHGGFEFWTDNGLLTLEDMEGLADYGKGAVVFTWTCQAQNYQYGSIDTPPQPSINEALILVPNGGAVACVGPAGITEPAQQRRLYLPLYDNLKSGMTLGQALRSAKVKALQSGESVRSVVNGWNLLGDPSLKLNWKTTNK